MLSEIFWNSFLVTSSGILLAIIAACYKSKCYKIKCGCLEIDRDVQGEEEIDIVEQQGEHKQ